MYTGEIYTSSPADSFDTYLSSNASWNEQPSAIHGGIPPRPIIEALHEEEEHEYIPLERSHRKAVLDDEQKASASLLTQNSANDAGSPITKSPHTMPTSSLSASPAAMFLSSFHSPVANIPKPDDEGQVVSGYTLGSIIGYGSSSIIRRASSSSGAIAAVKIIRRSDLVKAGNAPQARKRLQHEATVWTSLSHEHVLPLFSTVHSTYADYFFTLYCPAGSLFDILKRDGNPALPQDDTGMMLRQVVRGLRYLHEVARYVHRDLKLENVLVDEMGVCKIGDFGMSRRIGSLDEEDDKEQEQVEYDHPFAENNGLHRAVSLAGPTTRRHTNVFPMDHHLNRHNTTRHRNSTSTSEPVHPFQPGSLPYAAPELLLTQTSDAMRPHPSQDIWALGVMLYTLLTGSLPFCDSFEPRLQMKILHGTYKVPPGIGRGAERILQGCLDRSVASRWTIAMVDDVAWGVGWGSEGDDVTPLDTPDEIIPSFHSSKSQSRSRSRPGNIIVPESHDWSRDESSSRPSLTTASRRSASRVKRSLSRAPVLTDKSSSARSVSRSASRHPQDSTGSYLPDIISSSSSTSSDPYSTFLDDSALDVSPPSSSPMRRGRRQNKYDYLNSRSPSPSVVPTTPPDGALVISPDGLEQPDELNLDPESSRGRLSLRLEKETHDTGKQRRADFEEEIEDWSSQDMERDFEPTLSSNRSAPRRGLLLRGDGNANDDLVGLHDINDMLESGRRQRPSSSPPIVPRLQSVENSAHKTALEPFLKSSAAPSPTNMVFRSRSMENGRRQV
ncbi:hypothetical protein CVT25_000465 [Psilocybe cyanescens]|uniref:Protein kinase domain-containing protein n=1 Tax=Psilocybe cyanescens TaxID=93625 RepID=A0A409VNX3_PSICY|nr:hypothetical protein CVT25_000465 [Psilocybe cyanescens]